MKRKTMGLLRQDAFKISLVFLICGIGWVFIWNSMFNHFTRDYEVLTTARGVLFTFIAGGLFYFLIGRYEQRIKERQNQLQTLINSIPDFITFKDGNGRWIEANDFALHLFQLQSVEYRGKKSSDLAKFTPSHIDEFLACQASDEATWKQGKPLHREEVIRNSDGVSVTFDTTRVPIFHSDGSRKGILVLGRDITQRKEDTELLLMSEKLAVIGELAAGVAHEIRNPLTSIKGFLQLLSEREGNQAYCAIMLPELERVNQIVNEFLTIAKPQVRIQKDTNLVKLIQEVMVLLNTNAVEENVELIMNRDANIPSVHGDEDQLKQVVMNVLKNAIEASSDGDRVVIHVQQSGVNTVTIRVADNGSGIAEESLPKVGDPFFTTKDKGTGLGLLVCRRILEAHNGNLLISSRPDKGTTVDINLPVKRVEELSVSTHDKVSAYNV